MWLYHLALSPSNWAFSIEVLGDGQMVNIIAYDEKPDMYILIIFVTFG